MRSCPGGYHPWVVALSPLACLAACAAPTKQSPPAPAVPAASPVAPPPAAASQPPAANAEQLWQEVVAACERQNSACAPSPIAAVADAERKASGEPPACKEASPSSCELAAKQAVAALPTDVELRERCARDLHENGYSSTAAELVGGIGSDAAEAKRLLLVAAELYLDVADKGPNYRHYRNGMFVYQPSKDEEADKRWAAAQLEAAAQAAQRAVALAPAQADVLSVLASVREKQKRPADALAVLDRAPDAVAANPAATTQRARLLAQLGRDREAVTAYRQALDDEEFSSESWGALAKLYAKLGDGEAGKQAEERASYFSFLMPSSRLAFTSARAEKARGLASHFSDDEAHAEDWRATVAVLDRAGDEEAAELLASFVHWHSHDDAEERAFAALERQGAKVAPVLIRLVQGAGSVCTIRQAVAILSRLRPVAPETFTLALHALDNDRNPFFPIDAARALARLGDAKAVVPLLTATGCEPLVRPEDRRELPDRVRGESLLAAAVLDGAAARACIEQMRPNKDLARYAAAAACLAGGEDKPCRELVKSLRTKCDGTYFADAAIVGFLEDWSRDRTDRAKWSKQAAAGFKRCSEERDKQEARKSKASGGP